MLQQYYFQNDDDLLNKSFKVSKIVWEIFFDSDHEYDEYNDQGELSILAFRDRNLHEQQKIFLDYWLTMNKDFLSREIN